eukprot:6140587-Amphidinium_carterae.1
MMCGRKREAFARQIVQRDACPQGEAQAEAQQLPHPRACSQCFLVVPVSGGCPPTAAHVLPPTKARMLSASSGAFQDPFAEENSRECTAMRVVLWG